VSNNKDVFVFKVKFSVTHSRHVYTILPKHETNVTIKLITPVALEEKMRFAVREGGRTVGAGVVVKIIK